MIRLLTLLRDKRNIRWVDVILEPAVAVFAGMCAWALAEVTNTPDVLQAVMTSIGAWSGPRFIHKLEVRYFGGTRRHDSNDTTNFGSGDTK